MYRITCGTTKNLTDVEAFIETLGTNKSAINLFDKTEIFVTRSPGRLDVMGGIADYSGSLTLEMPIAEATLCALQKQDSRIIEIAGLNAAENNRTNHFEISLDEFEKDGKPIEYSTALQFFRTAGKQSWAAYIAGAFLVLMREKGFIFKHGSRILIDSKVPEGKGVSSSAAIEVAVMKAITAAFEIKVDAREIAILCQKVENLIVGAACGVMDQTASAGGKENQLSALLCQPAELLGTRQIPDEISFWGIDSGIRHSVGGGDYGSVRTGAFMGYRIIAAAAGLKVTPTEIEGFVRIEDTFWNGYLANITVDEFNKTFADKLPKVISGNDFLQKYQGITDAVTRVSPDKIYAIFYPTFHPISENMRVHQFDKLLNQPISEQVLKNLGELMYASHESYSACGLGSNGTDLLVKLVKENGKNLFGAKITGGGSGGTVAVLGRKSANDEIKQITAEYEKQTGHKPYIFSGSSIGAVEFDYLKLENVADLK